MQALFMTARSTDGSSTSSLHLLAHARRGDAGALGRLLDRCVPELTRWAHRRFPRWARTAADTADFVQDAVLHTFRRFRHLDVENRSALAAYLRAAVQNRMRDEHRRIARHGIHEPLDADAAFVRARVADTAGPDEALLASEREARYRAALARLSPQDREIVVAHVELEYSHDQIACMTGRSRNAARMALERAIRRLAGQLRDG